MKIFAALAVLFCLLAPYPAVGNPRARLPERAPPPASNEPAVATETGTEVEPESADIAPADAAAGEVTSADDAPAPLVEEVAAPEEESGDLPEEDPVADQSEDDAEAQEDAEEEAEEEVEEDSDGDWED